MPPASDITQLLLNAENGSASAVDRLFAALYDDLRRIAAERMRHEDPGMTLQATALVHEAYARMIDQTRARWQNRAHFLAVASQVMRRILVDHARSRGRQKRGGDWIRVPLAEQLATGGPMDEETLLALDDALRRLEAAHPEQARVVEMRFFGGLTQEESASVLGVTDRTIRRHWDFARAWLFRDLGAGPASA